MRSSDWRYGGTKWKLSRSRLELFGQCPRCFWLDSVKGIGRPKTPPFNLNIAVDALLKKEFDVHRADGSRHPLLERYGLDLVPYAHKELDAWRENFVGIQYREPNTGLLVTGAIDDVWVNRAGELVIVDYKATSKDGRIDSLSDSSWGEQYKRQTEVYQWLFRKKGFKVSDTGYFVYVNGRKDREAFDARLEFDVTLIPHVGDDSWVEGAIVAAKACLESPVPPAPGKGCEYCGYAEERADALDVQSPRVKKSKGNGKDDGERATESLF